MKIITLPRPRLNALLDAIIDAENLYEIRRAQRMAEELRAEMKAEECAGWRARRKEREA